MYNLNADPTCLTKVKAEELFRQHTTFYSNILLPYLFGLQEQWSLFYAFGQTTLMTLSCSCDANVGIS